MCQCSCPCYCDSDPEPQNDTDSPIDTPADSDASDWLLRAAWVAVTGGALGLF